MFDLGYAPWMWLIVGSYFLLAMLLTPLYRRMNKQAKCEPIKYKMIEYQKMKRN